MNRLSAALFRQYVEANPINAELLRRLPELKLAQCHLAAGCLFQAVWNIRSGRPAAENVQDYDLFYFAPDDLSSEAEERTADNCRRLMYDLNVRIDARNQARVHLWYEDYFGSPCPPLKSSRDGICRYLVECTSVGIEVSSGELYAPNGLDDLWDGVLRINPRVASRPDLFLAKAASYQGRWPWLRIVPPAEAKP